MLLGNGDGTFTAQTPQDAGGAVWKLVLGDVNGDGKLDVAAVNGYQRQRRHPARQRRRHAAARRRCLNTGGTEVGTVLGDLDGDGDLDWVISSFSGQQWHVFSTTAAAPSRSTPTSTRDPDANPSCAIMLDVDNDGDLDLALTDETSDLMRILQQRRRSVARLPAGAGHLPPAARASGGVLAHAQADSRRAGQEQDAVEMGQGRRDDERRVRRPAHTDGYTLCVYDAGALVSTSRGDGLLRDEALLGRQADGVPVHRTDRCSRRACSP